MLRLQKLGGLLEIRWMPHLAIVITSGIYFLSLILSLTALESPFSRANFIPANKYANVSLPLKLSRVVAKKAIVYQLPLEFTLYTAPHAMEFFFATVGTRPIVSRATLSNPSKSCIWEAPQNVALPDNSYLKFLLKKCDQENLSDLMLEIEIDRPTSLHIWTKQSSKEGTKRRVQEFLSIASPDLLILPVGNAELMGKKALLQKIELLAYSWDNTSSAVIMGIILVGIALTMTGLYIICFLPGQRSILATFLLFLGLSLQYLIITPPFQAPDEPDHLLTYAHINNDAYLLSDLLRLSNQNHFERIKFYSQEKFSSENIGSPLLGPWAGHVGRTEGEARSPLTAMIWKNLAPTIIALPTAQKIFSLRLFNILFVIGMTLLAMMPSRRRNESTEAYILVIASISTFWFFAMHVSNYFTMIGLMIPIGIIWTRLMAADNIGLWDNFVFGISAGLLPFTTASGKGTFIILLTLIIGLSLFTTKNRTFMDRLKASICFGFPILVSQVIYNSNLNKINAFKFSKSNIESSLYFAFFSLPFIFLLSPLSDKKIGCLRKKSSTLASGLLIVFLVISITFLIIQAIDPEMRFYLTNNEQTAKIPDIYYSARAALAFLANLLPVSPDYYVSKSFWFGYGWLDSVPDDLTVTAIKTLFSVLIVLGIIKSLFREASVHVFLLMLGATLFIAGMAFKLNQQSVNLHGRYLISCFILFSSIGAFGLFKIRSLKLFLQTMQGEIKNLMPLVSYISILAIHGYCLVFIINRYF